MAAVQSDGSTATTVELDDGSVWVTNDTRRLAGRLNLAIDELDYAVHAGTRPGVLQEGRSIFVSGRNGGVQRVDPLVERLTNPNKIVFGEYAIGGQVGAVLNPDEGTLWVGNDQSVVAPEYPDQADALVEQDSRLVVTQATTFFNQAGEAVTRGKVIVIGPDGWYEVHLDSGLQPLREGYGDLTDDTVPTTEPAPPTTVPAVVSGDEGDEEPQPEPLYRPDEPHDLGVPFDEIDQVSSVGAVPVVLTTDGVVAWTDAETGESRRVEVDGEEWALQQPGPESDAVLVASDEGLFEIPLGDPQAEPVELARVEGRPSAPVRLELADCAFGAWSSESPKSFKQCDGGVVEGPKTIEGAQPNALLVWRVNGRNIVLNDTRDGDIWADHDGTLANIGNWDDVEPSDDREEQEEETTGQSEVETERQCVYDGANNPSAGADEVGVRPRQSVIDLLHNDQDLNCEPLAITSLTPPSDWWGSLTVIDNGQHVLYSPSQEALERAAEGAFPFTFQYQAVDPDELTSAPADVTVTVRDPADGGNAPPDLRPKGDGTREMQPQVEAGKEISYDVMPDWYDPNGDELRLVSAVALTDGTVTATPEGVVSFAANGVDPGVYDVEVTLTDGFDDTTQTMEVTVKPIGSVLPPEAANDFVTVALNQTVTVEPLVNDTDGNGDPLTLQQLWTEGPDFRAVVLAGNVVEITALTPGVHEIPYSANDSTSEPARASIRMEVPAPSENNRAPVAVPDRVTLRPNRIVNVEVLGNDVDADGDLLGIVDIDVSDVDEAVADVRATVVDRRMLQIEVVAGTSGALPTGRFDVFYTVSDGFETKRAEAGASEQEKDADGARARGRVTLLIQPPDSDRLPEPKPDSAVVRTGTIVRIPVLSNDTDPDNDQIELRRLTPDSLEQFEADGGGVAWIEGRDVMVWGHTPRPNEVYTLNYEVEANGKRMPGQITLTVMPLASTEIPNRPPTPTNLVLRAVRNSEVRLEVPASMLDPDGDPVTVTGVGAPSRPGNSTGFDGNVITFIAGPGMDPDDSFTYTVFDGEFAVERSVRVLVLPQQAWPPVAHDDVWRAEPGRTLRINVLENDVSPQDIDIRLAERPFYDIEGTPSAQALNPDQVSLLPQDDEDTQGFIQVEVPTQDGTLVEQYAIVDAQGRGSKASIRVTPDSNAPNMAPIARPDTELKAEDVKGLTEVSIDVLENDMDPDQDPDDPGLDLEIAPFQSAGARIENGMLVVPVLDYRQTILYKITDADGDYSIGFANVPDSANHQPELSAWGADPSVRVIEASAATPLHISLAEAVTDPDGDTRIELTERELELLQGAPAAQPPQRDVDDLGFTYYPPEQLTVTTTVWIQFEVTDEPDLSPEERDTTPRCNCESLLQIAIVIEAQSPPVIVGPGSVTVPRIDEAVTYDVTALSYDREGDSLVYEFDTSGIPLTIETDGPRLSIVSDRAEDQLPPVGSSYTLPYTVSDQNPAWDPVAGQVVITIGTTNAPPPVAGSMGPFDDVVRGEEYTIPVNLIDAAFNPFGAERPLELVDPSVNAPGQLTCNPDGSCTFLAADAVGTFVANYTLRDDDGRTAQGTFTLGVKGAPRAPGVPAVVSVGDHVVNLEWQPADMQLGEFVKYVVTATGDNGSTLTRDALTPSLAFDNLVNDVSYTFSVIAVNEVGNGEPSGVSSPGVPDRVPDPPVALAFTDYGDARLDMQWAPPPTAADFSAITDFEVELVGAATQTVPGNQTTVSVSTLTNGQQYTFRVRARNNSGWGAWSTTGVGSGDAVASGKPSRAPDAPAAPSARNTGDGGAPRLRVTWAPPGYDGGRPVVQYRVCMSAGPCQTVSAPTTQATFDAQAGAAPTFTVVAINTTLAAKGNESPPSAASAAVTALQRPAVPALTVTAPASHTIVASATAQGNAGCAQQFEYRIRQGTGAWSAWGASNQWNDRANGQPHSVEARAYLPASCGATDARYESPATAGGPATPYGDTVAASLSVSGAGTQTITWNWNLNTPSNNDSGRAWTASLSGDCGSGNITAESTGSRQINPGRTGQTYSCTVTISAPGTTSKPVTQSARAQDPPPPTAISVWLSSTPSSNQPGTCAGNCRIVYVRGAGFTPNSSLQVNCEGDSRWFNLGSTDASGGISDRDGICRTTPGSPQLVTVRDASGRQASATAS